MQEKTTSVAATSAAIGLSMHKGKSRIFRYNTACTDPITIDGEDLEDVKTFAYLGRNIDEHSGSDADVKARIGNARATYLQLKNIWNSKQLSTNTKLNASVIKQTTTFTDFTFYDYYQLQYSNEYHPSMQLSFHDLPIIILRMGTMHLNSNSLIANR
ncbi:unnamed protein product [Schistosoma margrebowiei]|uniref:Uncharacterized protein n=1 Tax=Schistosoma margrebowiei TaxID=48269 RepID=A0A183M2N5_9TREM|nr:unnamed protein product [Schistosoma margrebowiei]